MTTSAPTPSGSTCRLQHPLLPYAGHLGRAGLLAAALGIGATLGSAGVAWADAAADSGSRTSTSAATHGTSQPGGSAPSAEGQRAPSSPSRRPGGIRIGAPAPDNPIPGFPRGGSRMEDNPRDSGAPSPDARREAPAAQPGPPDPATPPRMAADQPGTAISIPARVMIDPAVTRVTASHPTSQENLQVSNDPSGSSAASVDNDLSLYSRQPRREAAVTVGAAAATIPGPPNGAVVVGLSTVTSSALTQSLSQSTTGLTGTVLGLDPAFFPVMGLWMDGFATSNGRKFRRVWYPNIPSRRNSELGVAALDKQLHETPGLKIVFGHSMGAQVAAKWLREKGPTSDIPASDVVFILGGNPERKYGGALLVPATPKLWGFWPIEPTYGGPGIPDDTPYTVIDYARQYDWWADAPTSLTPSRTAQLNASQGIHSDYFRVGIDDPDVLTYVEGNRIYKLKPTAIPASKRAVVEQSYSRPTG